MNSTRQTLRVVIASVLLAAALCTAISASADCSKDAQTAARQAYGWVHPVTKGRYAFGLISFETQVRCGNRCQFTTVTRVALCKNGQWTAYPPIDNTAIPEQCLRCYGLGWP